MDGTIFKSVPMADELAEVIDEQKRKSIEQHGREPGPDDSLFFDMPPFEHAEHFMVEAMKQTGLDPAVVYAFEKTGLLTCTIGGGRRLCARKRVLDTSR